MTIVRWDPFFATADTWVPPVDIYQTGDHELVLKAELPDMAREDIDITVENFVLTITGEKKLRDAKEDKFHHTERSYGAFSRSFSITRQSMPARYQQSTRTAAESQPPCARSQHGRSGEVAA